MRSYTTKKVYIGSVVNKILGYRQKKPYYFYNRILKAYLCHYNVFSRLIDYLFVLLASHLQMLSSLFIIRKLTKIIP